MSVIDQALSLARSGDPDGACELTLAEWRRTRRSAHADALVLFSRAGKLAPRIDRIGIDTWRASWRAASPADRGPLLDELSAYARMDFGRAEATHWALVTEAMRELVGGPPDPRIGRALERALLGSSDHLYAPNEVAHIVPPAMAAEPPGPSFAKMALARISVDADDCTRVRVADLAERVAREADCNGAQLSSDLRALHVRLPPSGELLLAASERAAIEAWIAETIEPARELAASLELHDASLAHVVLRSGARPAGRFGLATVGEAHDPSPRWRLAREVELAGYVSMDAFVEAEALHGVLDENVADLAELPTQVQHLSIWMRGAHSEREGSLLRLFRDQPDTFARLRSLRVALEDGFRFPTDAPVKKRREAEAWRALLDTPQGRRLTTFSTAADGPGCVERWIALLTSLDRPTLSIELDDLGHGSNRRGGTIVWIRHDGGGYVATRTKS